MPIFIDRQFVFVKEYSTFPKEELFALIPFSFMLLVFLLAFDFLNQSFVIILKSFHIIDYPFTLSFINIYTSTFNSLNILGFRSLSIFLWGTSHIFIFNLFFIAFLLYFAILRRKMSDFNILKYTIKLPTLFKFHLSI